MKSAAVLLLSLCILCGCKPRDQLLDQASELRERLLAANQCAFQAVIHADYGEELYSFQMDCTVDNAGTLTFSVTAPESISGITGKIDAQTASLTFEDKVLAFPVLAEGQISPVAAPWLLIHTLKSGYLSGCGREAEGACIYLDDSFYENPLHLEIHTDSEMTPKYAEMIWENRRILSVEIENFSVQ